MRGINAITSRGSDEWQTPPALFEALDRVYGFDLDPSASEENHLCSRYFTAAQDGLQQPWSGRVFCNPPYSRVAAWAEKCAREAGNCDVIVMLVPARTDTKWFHKFVYHNPNARITFLQGRLHYSGSKIAAPFPSMIVEFRRLIY